VHNAAGGSPCPGRGATPARGESPRPHAARAERMSSTPPTPPPPGPQQPGAWRPTLCRLGVVAECRVLANPSVKVMFLRRSRAVCHLAGRGVRRSWRGSGRGTCGLLPPAATAQSQGGAPSKGRPKPAVRGGHCASPRATPSSATPSRSSISGAAGTGPGLRPAPAPQRVAGRRRRSGPSWAGGPAHRSQAGRSPRSATASVHDRGQAAPRPCEFPDRAASPRSHARRLHATRGQVGGQAEDASAGGVVP
jgi:hypothetical protein